MSITGTWDCVVDSPMGRQASTVTLVESGTELSGEVKGTMSVDQILHGSF